MRFMFIALLLATINQTAFSSGRAGHVRTHSIPHSVPLNPWKATIPFTPVQAQAPAVQVLTFPPQAPARGIKFQNVP